MMSSAWDGVSDYGPLFIPVAVAFGAAVHLWLRRRTADTRTQYEIVLSWLFGGVVGVGGLVVAASHLFFAAPAAEQIGFPAGNPFQFEVGIANLAFAVLGLACLWMKEKFWEATAIGLAVFYWGAAVGHLIELIVHHDYAPYNAGPILITDFGVPLVILVVLFRMRRSLGERRQQR